MKKEALHQQFHKSQKSVIIRALPQKNPGKERLLELRNQFEEVLKKLKISQNVKIKFILYYAETEISENLIFCSTEVVKKQGKKKIEFYLWLFELPANLCRPICPPGPLGWHWLAGSSDVHW